MFKGLGFLDSAFKLNAVVLLASALCPATEARSQSRPAEAGSQADSATNPLGFWESVDFVSRIEEFKPGRRKWQGDLFLKEFQFLEGGKTALHWTWRGDSVTHSNGRTRYQYHVRTIEGTPYLFLPWLSGDVTERGQKPSYYVLKKSSRRAQTPQRQSADDHSFTTVRAITSVKEYDDVRFKDMSALNLAGSPGLPATLTFNEATVWPESTRMPRGCNPKRLLHEARNPGLGIRELHAQGITGTGVNVAIIDQPLYQDHPEFAGKITAYHDVGCKSESSMHGPAVVSLLVGNKCGTAPGARVYYVAAPSWTGDAAYYAEALDWLREQGEKLPQAQKIRVVSVSAAPSGAGSPFKKNGALWDQACVRAEAAGMLVLDCTAHHRFVGPCFFNGTDAEDPAQCRPGFPGMPARIYVPDHLLVPCSPRTTAEEYDKGKCSYQYCGRGGLSWAIPYCAGVLALGWQVQPGLTASEMREILLQSASVTAEGARIINPAGFIRTVKASRPPVKRGERGQHSPVRAGQRS